MVYALFGVMYVWLCRGRINKKCDMQKSILVFYDFCHFGVYPGCDALDALPSLAWL